MFVFLKKQSFRRSSSLLGHCQYGLKDCSSSSTSCVDSALYADRMFHIVTVDSREYYNQPWEETQELQSSVP